MPTKIRTWLSGLGLNTRILLIAGLPVLLTAFLTTLVVHWSTRHFVESAIGDQMVMQARIVAELVAIAEKEEPAGMSSQAINEHLNSIARFAREHGNYDYEFWITDSSGKVYLGTEAVEFTFKKEQPQAGVFLSLLDRDGVPTDIVVQASRRREIDGSVFKYVGVGGVDKPRIVQVGYETNSLFAQLASKNYLLAASIAGLVLVSGVLAYFALRRILTRPLDALIQAAKAVEADRYAVGSLAQVRARGDELGRLASVFEDMVVKLSEQYDSLVNFMRSAVLKIRGDGVITFANVYATELLGFANAELVGSKLSRILPPECQDDVQQRVGALKSDDIELNAVNQNITKTGERIWMTWSNRVIHLGDGGDKELLCVGTDITEDVRQKQQLQEMIARLEKAREADERLHLILQSTSEGIFGVDTAGKINFVNPAACRMLGFTSDELIGQPSHAIIHHHRADGRDYPQHECPMYAAYTEGKASRIRDEHLWRKDGSGFPVEYGATPMEREGALVGAVISFSDITERVSAERRVRETEQFYGSVLELAPDGLMVVGTDGLIQLANAQCEKLFGYTRAELLGKPVEMLVPMESRGGHSSLRAGYHRSPTKREMGVGGTLGGVRKDGLVFPVEIGLSPLPARQGTGVEVAVSIRDITERRRDEAELQKRAKELQHINFLADSALDLTRAGYWHVPLDGSGWYSSSERAARIFGDPPTPDHRYRLEHWAEHVRLGDETAAKFTAENFAGAVAGTVPVYDSTYAYKRPVDGRIVWIHALGHVVKDASGKPTDMYGVTQDITAFKEMELELRQAMQKAEEATKAKSAFLANMSHEIRTPMNGIMGMTELALDTELSAEQRDYLNTVKSSADALLSIINDILDFSKIEAGRIELDPVDFLLRDSLSDTLNPLALRASSKSLELAYDVHREVPDALIGDVYRLRQVIVNLVGNAIKFTQKGEVVVTVRLLERHADDLLLELAVRDTGIGIDPAAAARLFKPFEQAETSTTRKYGGTGLGLAISKQLVELMGGSIRLESKAGVGSSFIFTVKFKAGAARASTSAEDASRVLTGKTALIVDDNETNLRILGTMLRHWGLRTLQAESGAQALAMLDRTASAGDAVSLIITDLHMPEMDGFELIETIRARAASSTLPIMLLTSSASTGDQDRCNALKVAARLLKPVKQSLLLDNLMRLLVGASRLDRSSQPDAAPAARPAIEKALRVLLAEDNPVNQKFAIRLLEGAGHKVAVAQTGRQAVDLWNSGGFDLILMDVQMPEMDGLDATREIRSRESGSGKRISIIAMTANAMAGDREMCIEAGMDGYVAKPVKKDVLFAEIGRVNAGASEGDGRGE